MKYWFPHFLLLCFILSACAPKQIQDEPIEFLQAPKVSKKGAYKSADWKLFFKAEQAYSFKKFEQATHLYKLAKKKNRRGRVHLISSYRLGTIYYTQGQFRRASAEFTHILEKFPRSDLEFDVSYNLAASEFQLRNYEAAYAALAELSQSKVKRQGPARASMVYRLTALSAMGIHNYPAAVVALTSQVQLPLGASKRKKILGHIDRLLGRIETRLELETLLAKVTEPSTRAKIQERLHSIDAEVAEADSGAIATSTSGVARVDLFESGSSNSAPIENHIGVILPLSGKWAPVGKRALDSILLASKLLQEQRQTNFRIFIKDTRSNPITAAHAVDALVNQNKVFAIIGPISWKESLAVARRSQKLGVPNILLTLKEGLSSRGSHLFQTGLTPRVQLENLVRHCIEELDFKRFAILGPNDSYGKDMITQFWDLVEKNGGRVVAYENYPAKETDFQTYIRSMVGLDKPQLRKKEWEALEAYLEEQNKDRRGRKAKANLPPIVDFDAIFIPDSARALGQIAPSLAYLDVSGIPLLGTVEWQNAKLYQRGGRYVEGAIFPGGINLETENPKQQRFISQYNQAYGRAPDLLAAQAFEAMEILGLSIPRLTAQDRNLLVRELSQLREYPTTLGKITFDDTRVARRTLPIFTIGRGGRILQN